jgi:hypothetical protein
MAEISRKRTSNRCATASCAACGVSAPIIFLSSCQGEHAVDMETGAIVAVTTHGAAAANHLGGRDDRQILRYQTPLAADAATPSPRHGKTLP